jgi:hypothetical protein
VAGSATRRIRISISVGIVVLLIAATAWTLLHYRVIGGKAATSKHTQTVTVIAVGINGQPVDGYRQLPDRAESSNVVDVFGCLVSPAAVSPGIYYCAPAAAGADVCWRSGPGALLCLDDPWSKGLRRVTYADPLPQVQPAAAPKPLALQLEDGTQCRLRNGGAWGGRDDGLVGAYGCAGETLAVLVAVSPTGGESPIDRSQPLWTVKVGALGSGAAHLPPPQTRAVSTAWFAGTSGAN